MTKLLTEWPDSFSTSYDSSIIWLSLNHTNGGDGFPKDGMKEKLYIEHNTILSCYDRANLWLDMERNGTGK